MHNDDARRSLFTIFQAALQAVNGHVVVHDWLHRHPMTGPVYLLAVGKAACAMARGAHATLGNQIADALLITKHGYAEWLPWPVHEAGHPRPDDASLEAGVQLQAFISAIPSNAQVLVLLSGGASALVEALPPGMTLGDLQSLNDWLLGSGLDIHSLNLLRKRLSCIKGGRLAQQLAPRRVLCLAISDVPGDDPRAIGSGPLVADERQQDTMDDSQWPEFVQTLLQLSPPAPRAEDPCFNSVRVEVIASLRSAMDSAAEAARAMGLMVTLHPALLTGDAADAGRLCAQALAASAPGTLHVWGGETTVVMPPQPGRGGRCQQLALAAAQEIAGRDEIWLLAGATDGTDGPGDEAGALVDGQSIFRGHAEGLDISDCLGRADSGRFLEASGDLIQTGPTGTNVMDLVLGLQSDSKS